MMNQSMSRSSASLVVMVGLALGASAAPAAAQRNQTIVRTRSAPVDSLEPKLRRMERSIDSLVRRFDEELSAERRLKLRHQIDARFADFMALRMSAREGRPKDGNTFIWRMPEAASQMRVGTDGGMLFPRLAQTAMATGWIGIVVSGAPSEIRLENNEMYMRYLSYPEIASVDPSSPAQQAGVAPGDTLMAYNGHDVWREEISLTRLLRPKATVTVRVRREGRVKELPVVVAEVPARIKLRRSQEMRDGDAPWVALRPEVVFPRLPSGTPAPPATRAFSPPPPSRSFGGTPMVASAPPLPPVFGVAPSGVAGAQVVTVSETMKRSLDLPAGVLITAVPIGSPAGESGLEEGDVILRVGSQPVRTVLDMREMVARAAEEGNSSVVLELRRGKERRTLTLRW
jgi:membrane-associated protease RseP (regulator of RpoE activity)